MNITKNVLARVAGIPVELNIAKLDSLPFVLSEKSVLKVISEYTLDVLSKT